jgi:hypothetical protein
MSGRLLDRPTRLQAADRGEEPAIVPVEIRALAVRERLRAQRHRDIEVATDLDTEEAGRRDADNLKGVAVECDRAPERGGAAAIFALPEPVADDGGRRRAAAPIVRSREHAPKHRAHLEGVEEIAAHPQTIDRPTLTTGAQVELGGSPCERAGERFLPIADALP